VLNGGSVRSVNPEIARGNRPMLWRRGPSHPPLRSSSTARQFVYANPSQNLAGRWSGVPRRREPGRFSLYVIEGHETGFNALVRRLIDEAGPSFVVFPRSDGKGGYDCVFVIPQTDPD
jgi:hypothetical protein